jgi:hypothetical protein
VSVKWLATAVDAHVEQGETAIAPIVRGSVELANHRGDVRLEQTIADHHHRQAEQEQRLAGQHHHKQAGRHHQRTEQDRALVADHLVRHVAAENAGGIDQRGIGAVDLAGPGLAGGIAVVEVRHDVQRQCPAHAIERKAFPELGHEQHPQGARMPKGLRKIRRGRWRRHGVVHAKSPANRSMHGAATVMVKS